MDCERKLLSCFLASSIPSLLAYSFLMWYTPSIQRQSLCTTLLLCLPYGLPGAQMAKAQPQTQVTQESLHILAQQPSPYVLQPLVIRSPAAPPNRIQHMDMIPPRFVRSPSLSTVGINRGFRGRSPSPVTVTTAYGPQPACIPWEGCFFEEGVPPLHPASLAPLLPLALDADPKPTRLPRQEEQQPPKEKHAHECFLGYPLFGFFLWREGRGVLLPLLLCLGCM